MLLLLLAAGMVAVPASVESCWTGKVLEVADGDSLTVLRKTPGGRALQVEIRLAAIDAPEFGQPWSRKARAHLNSLTYDRRVRVCPLESNASSNDRHGRLVADLYVADTRVSEAMLMSGLGVAARLLQQGACPCAAASRRPRRNASASGQTKSRCLRGDGRTIHVSEPNSTPTVFHAPWCPYYRCPNSTIRFASRTEATAAGFRPGGVCKP